MGWSGPQSAPRSVPVSMAQLVFDLLYVSAWGSPIRLFEYIPDFFWGFCSGYQRVNRLRESSFHCTMEKTILSLSWMMSRVRNGTRYIFWICKDHCREGILEHVITFQCSLGLILPSNIVCVCEFHNVRKMNNYKRFRWNKRIWKNRWVVCHGSWRETDEEKREFVFCQT